jgi:predicted nucleic acid-binding Zn ribbon protein
MAKRKQRRDEFQDISSYSSKQAYKKNQKKKKRTGLKVFLSFICVILVLVGGVMIYASTVLLGDLKTTTITKDGARYFRRNKIGSGHYEYCAVRCGCPRL